MLAITIDDLLPLAPNLDEDKARVMIEDALALAKQEAPCVFAEDADPDKVAAARAIIRAAISRWNDQGSGGLTQMTADVFGMRIDNRQPRQAGGFYKPELMQLRRLCTGRGGAYSIDLAAHAGLGPEWWEPDE